MELENHLGRLTGATVTQEWAFCAAKETRSLNLSMARSLVVKVKPLVPHSESDGEERTLVPASADMGCALFSLRTWTSY